MVYRESDRIRDYAGRWLKGANTGKPGELPSGSEMTEYQKILAAECFRKLSPELQDMDPYDIDGDGRWLHVEYADGEIYEGPCVADADDANMSMDVLKTTRNGDRPAICYPDNDIPRIASGIRSIRFTTPEEARKAAKREEIIGPGGTVGEGYMGASTYTGGKYDPRMSEADKSKSIRQDLKALQKLGDIPKDWKISVRKNSYSGGYSIYATITAPRNEIFEIPTADELFERSYDGDRQADRVINNFREKYDTTDRAAMDKHFNEIRKEFNDPNVERPRNSDLYRIETDDAKRVSKLANRVLASYRHTDSNSMVDYFNDDGYFNFEYRVTMPTER